MSIVKCSYLGIMDTLRIVPAAEYSEEAIRNVNLFNVVSIVEHTATISATNDSRVIPAILAVFEQYVIPIISISMCSLSVEDIFIYLNSKGLDGGNGDDHEADRRRSL